MVFGGGEEVRLLDSALASPEAAEKTFVGSEA